MNRSTSAFFLFLVSSAIAFSQSNFNLGVNLDDNGAFVNLIDHTNRYSKATGFDSLGWAQSDFDLVLLDGRPATEWTGAIDDPEQYRINYSGRYKCSFIGSANVGVSGTSVAIENKAYDAGKNLTTFDLVIGGFPNANHGLVFLSFTNTQRSAQAPLNSGITNLRVHRPGYELSSAKIFTDEYIRLCKAADFACYRFYNVQNIWDGEPAFPAKTEWRNRKTPQDASQDPMTAMNGKRDGWCWDHIVALANILKKDVWLNVHISCDSVYVTNLAQFLKTNLDASIKIYVENSNEVWSPTQATHGPYNQAQATANGITFDQNYARRTVELSNWFSVVFGQNEINNRIRVILAGQHAYNGRSDNHLNYIRNRFGEPKNFIYATSSALYFGSTKATSTNPTDINDGMMEDINNQITNAQASTYRLNHVNKAKSWGLKGGCTSYEGGAHLPAGGGTANLGNQILAHRTARMREVIKRNYIEGWKQLDGGLAMYFTLVSGYNRYGCWGLTDDYTNPDRNYKMQAVREIASSMLNVEERAANGFSVRIFPNPILDDFTMEITSEKAERISISFFDPLGRKLGESKSGWFDAGVHRLRFSEIQSTSGFVHAVIGIGEKVVVRNFFIAR